MKENFPRSYLNTTEIYTKSLDLGFDTHLEKLHTFISFLSSLLWLNINGSNECSLSAHA
jgi:hypothetical protein